jgi:hypothetical protein
MNENITMYNFGILILCVNLVKIYKQVLINDCIKIIQFVLLSAKLQFNLNYFRGLYQMPQSIIV